jgi:hypothetical protein
MAPGQYEVQFSFISEVNGVLIDVVFWSICFVGPKPVPSNPPRFLVSAPASRHRSFDEDEDEPPETELSPAQRLINAKVTLRAVTHNPSFDFTTLNVLTLVQDIVHPFPVPPDVVVDRVDVSGYLSKKGEIRRNWSRRWFVLSLLDKRMAYYTDDSQTVIKGLIHLNRVIRVQADGDLAQFGFAIVTEDRKYRIRAESELGLKVWMGVLGPLAIDLAV